MTTLELVPPAPVTNRPPRRTGADRSRTAGELIVCAASGLAVTWILAYLTDLGHGLGALLVWYLSAVAAYVYLSRRVYGRARSIDRLTTVAVYTAAAIAAVPIFLIIGDVVGKGASDLRIQFFTQTSVKAGPLEPVTQGGALQAVVGTLEQVGIAVALVVPLGIMVAVYLSEVPSRAAGAVRAVVEAMSGLPAIIAGVFIYTVVVSGLRTGDTGLAGALALAVTMLPIVTRASEEILRLVPGGLREASLALGAPRWRSVLRVVLPTARTGLVTAAILAVARAAGETAPLILTSGTTERLNTNPLHGIQDSLPMYIYSRISSPNANQVQRAWIGSFVLIALVLILFTIARVIGGRQKVGDRA